MAKRLFPPGDALLAKTISLLEMHRYYLQTRAGSSKIGLVDMTQTLSLTSVALTMDTHQMQNQVAC